MILRTKRSIAKRFFESKKKGSRGKRIGTTKIELIYYYPIRFVKLNLINFQVHLLGLHTSVLIGEFRSLIFHLLETRQTLLVLLKLLFLFSFQELCKAATDLSKITKWRFEKVIEWNKWNQKENEKSWFY